MKLIDYDRFNAAAERLARRELCRRVNRYNPPIQAGAEFEAVLRRAMLPRAWVKLAARIFKRGHIILDFKTREALRNFGVEISK